LPFGEQNDKIKNGSVLKNSSKKDIAKFSRQKALL
jgi:hypothetical protein